MKTVYITYFKGGTKYKAELDEASYEVLKQRNDIIELKMFSDRILMESDYRGYDNNKTMLHG